LIYIYHHISLNSFIPSPWQTISKRCHWFSAASDYAKEWEVGICIYIWGQATNLPFSSSDNVTGYATWQAIHLFGLSFHPPSPVRSRWIYFIPSYHRLQQQQPADNTVRALLYTKSGGRPC
jgi:hypothetical protein